MRKIAAGGEGAAGASTFPQPSAVPQRVLAGLHLHGIEPGSTATTNLHLLVTVRGNPQVSAGASKAPRVS